MPPALLLIDIQNDYFPGGNLEVDQAETVAGQAAQLLQAFRELDLPRIHIQHLSTRPGATFFLAGTPGVEIHADVRPGAGEPVFQKNFPNSFRDTGLDDYLHEQAIDQLVICGMMSQMCIDATTRAAFDKGYKCMVAHDACAARALSFNGAAIPASQVHGAFMAALGVVHAEILPTEQIIASLPA